MSRAGLHRQVAYGGLRIGMYEPVRNFLVGPAAVEAGGPAPLHTKIAAGLFTGGLAIAIANPTDLVKVRADGACENLHLALPSMRAREDCTLFCQACMPLETCMHLSCLFLSKLSNGRSNNGRLRLDRAPCCDVASSRL